MSSSVEDPVVRSARREALMVLAIWLAAFAYTAGYCLRFGYGREVGDLTFVLGFPDWVFWGIVVPWVVCLAISWWFAYCFMTDEDLGEEAADEELNSASPDAVRENGNA